MDRELASLNKDGPALLRGALDASWPPALLRALRRAFPWLPTLPGPERVEFLRAVAAAEEPEALAALAAAGPGAWKVAWEAGERPTAFHVCLARHDGPVRVVAVGEFEDGLFVASGGDDHVVRLRDAFDQSGPDLEGHMAGIRALAFGVIDGRPVLASGDHGGTIHTWDPLTGARGFTRDTSAGHPAALSFVVDREGRPLLAVAIGYDDPQAWPDNGRVDLLDPVTGALVRELRADDGDTMLDLAVAKLGERTVLVSVSPYNLYVWDVTTGEPLGTAELSQDWAELSEEWEDSWYPDKLAPPLLMRTRDGRPEAGVVVVRIDPRTVDEDGRDVVYLDLDNLDDMTVGEEFGKDQGPVAMTTHAGQTAMLVANRAEPIKEWELPANAVITHSDRETDIDLDADTRLITAAAFGSLDGRLRLATAGLDGTVQLWDAQAPHGHRRTGHGGSGLALFTGEQGTPVLAAGTHSGTVFLLDAAGGTEIGELGCRESDRNHDCDQWPYDHCCQGLAAGDVAGRPYLATSGCAAYGTMLWEPLSSIRGIAHKDDTKGRATFTGWDHDESSSSALAFGEVEGRSLLAAGVEVWDPLSHERVAKLAGFGFLLSESAFGRAGDQPVLATRRKDRVSLWNPLTGAHLRALGTDDTGAGLAMGRVAGYDVLTAGSGTDVHLWDAATGQRQESIPHTSTVTCLSLVDHGDRALLVTGTEDGTVALWDAVSRRRLAVLGVFARPVRSVAAATIRGDLHVYGQSRYGRVLAWRVSIP